MKSNFVDRWNNNINLLSSLKDKNLGTEQNPVDFRGIPIGSQGVRRTLEKVRFSYVDFSYADFEECNFMEVEFSNCTFNSVNFSELRMWNCTFDHCNFESSNFNNATLGVHTKFFACNFTKAKLKGKYFNFGSFTLFDNCNFLNCDIRSAWILSTTFKNCKFQSKFTNIRFSGSFQADIQNKSEKGNYPATLHNCSLIESRFYSVEIMDGVILDSCELPAQPFERFNESDIFYPSPTN